MQRKTAVELGIIGVLTIALVFASFSLIKRMGEERRASVAKGTPPASPAKALDGSGKLSSVIKVRRIKDDNFYTRLSRVADVLPLDRDPFSFGGAGPRSLRDNLELAGILWEEKTPTAIIDEGFYKTGDSNDQFEVIKILQDRVVLRDSAGEFELRLKS